MFKSSRGPVLRVVYKKTHFLTSWSLMNEEAACKIEGVAGIKQWLLLGKVAEEKVISEQGRLGASKSGDNSDDIIREL